LKCLKDITGRLGGSVKDEAKLSTGTIAGRPAMKTPQLNVVLMRLQ
jgi:hypothetical protein